MNLLLRFLPMGGVFILVIALIIARYQIVFVRKIPGVIFWSIVAAVLVVAGIVFLVRWLKARREAEAVKKGLFAQGEESAQSARADLQNQIKEINQNLSNAIARLETGPDGKKTLYTIPWYLIMGPSGCGKTTAIKNSGLSFPGMSQAEKLQGTGGTRNCTWWLSSDAIILDTAGRYVSGSDRSETQEEWVEFLELLRRHRKHSPLNGLLVAYSVEDLITYDEAKLIEEAGALRERLDEIMKQLSWTFPTYMVFMKSDLVDGFVEFFRTLPPGLRRRAWGSVYPTIEGADQQVAARFRERFGALIDTLRAHRAAAVSPEAQTGGDWPRAMMFPERFVALESKIALFLDTLFQSNPYAQDFPRLRGTFFTSGMQEGVPIDLVVKEIESIVGAGSMAPAERTPSDDAYFVQSIFTQYLRADRDLARRTQASTLRRKKRRFAFTVAAGVASILWCVWSSISCGALQSKIHRTGNVAQELLGDYERPLPEDLARLDALGDQVNGSWNIWPLVIGQRAKSASQDVYEAESRRRVLRVLERHVASRLGTETEAEPLRDLIRTELVFSEPDHPEVGAFDLGRALLGVATAGPMRDPAPALQQRLRTIADEYMASGRPLVDTLSGRTRNTLRGAAERLARAHDPRELLDQLVRAASEESPAVTVEDLGGSGTSRVLTAGETVRGAFTRDGWDNYLAPRIRDLEKTIEADNRLITTLGARPSDVGGVHDAVVSRYVEDFEDEWAHFFSSVRLRSAQGCKEAADVLDDLRRDGSPFLRLFEAAGLRTDFRVGSPNPLPDAPPDPIERARAPLVTLIEKKDAVADALKDAYGAVKACDEEGSLDAGKVSDAGDAIEDVQSSLSASGLSIAVSELLERPVAYAGSAIRSAELRDVVTRWRRGPYAEWQALRERYPFDPGARSMANVSDVCALLRKGGTLDRFIGEVASQGVAVGAGLTQARAQLDRIRSSLEISELSLRSPFTLTLAPNDVERPYGVGAVEGNAQGDANKALVEQVAVEIQGKRLATRQVKREERFIWSTSADDLTCFLEVSVGGRPPARIEFGQSAWSFFQLYDAARVSPGGRLVWSFDDLGIWVEADLRTVDGSPNMFGRGSAFRGFSLPENPFD